MTLLTGVEQDGQDARQPVHFTARWCPVVLPGALCAQIIGDGSNESSTEMNRLRPGTPVEAMEHGFSTVLET